MKNFLMAGEFFDNFLDDLFDELQTELLSKRDLYPAETCSRPKCEVSNFYFDQILSINDELRSINDEIQSISDEAWSINELIVETNKNSDNYKSAEFFLKEPPCNSHKQVKICHLRGASGVIDACLP